MDMYEYKTKGTCSTKINFAIGDGKLSSVKFENGCNGNLKALSALLEGMDTSEAVKRLKGIQCDNRGTSCADQMARAIEQFT
jgi:uncharacterized protein (TIGR03905 family)